LRNALLGQLDEHLLSDTLALGKVFETLVHEHCRRLQFYLSGPNARVFYWRTPQGHEVDIVMEVASRPVPVEVTSGNEVPSKKLRGLEEFEKEHHPPFSIVVTGSAFDLRGQRVYLPLWLFLLMC
jgi:predicted AAA+ superfamily ATPase